MRLNKNTFYKILSSIIGAIFIFSAFSKLADIKHFTNIILQYEIDIFVYTIPFLIIAEIFIGVEMFFHLNIKRNSLLSIILLFFLSLIYTYGFAIKGVEDCGCFGSSLQMSAVFVFIRNVVLIFFSILIYKNTEQEKEDKFRKTIALIVLGFGVFFTGNYFRLPSNINVVKPSEPELLHKNINNTEFADSYKFDSDSTYIIFAFSYSCPHCLNSIENVKNYNHINGIDKVVFFSTGSINAKIEFNKYFNITGIPNIENRITEKTVTSFPTSFIVRNNKIVNIYVGALPSNFVFSKKYLNFTEN